MRVISLAGSPRIPSRSAALLALSQNWLRQQGVEVTAYTLHDFDAEDLLYANFNSPAIKAFADQLAQADGLLISTPVYKASFSGALKTLLDLLPERALDHKVVLPLATGGSVGHMLAVDHALKPVLAALKAQEVLHGVFADDSQIQLTGEGATLTDAVAARLEEALASFYLALGRKPPALRRLAAGGTSDRLKGLEKESLNERTHRFTALAQRRYPSPACCRWFGPLPPPRRIRRSSASATKRIGQPGAGEEPPAAGGTFPRHPHQLDRVSRRPANARGP